MGDVGSARYERTLLPPCPTIRVWSYSNCQRSNHSICKWIFRNLALLRVNLVCKGILLFEALTNVSWHYVNGYCTLSTSNYRVKMEIKVRLACYITCSEITRRTIVIPMIQEQSSWNSLLTLTLPGPSAGVSESLDSYCSLKPLCSGMGEVVGSSTSPIPSHCAVIILFQSVPVHQLSRLAP